MDFDHDDLVENRKCEMRVNPLVPKEVTHHGTFFMRDIKERPAKLSVFNGANLFYDETGMEPLEGKQWKADAVLAKDHLACLPLSDNVRHPTIESYYEAELKDMTEGKLEFTDQHFRI